MLFSCFKELSFWYIVDFLSLFFCLFFSCLIVIILSVCIIEFKCSHLELKKYLWILMQTFILFFRLFVCLTDCHSFVYLSACLVNFTWDKVDKVFIFTETRDTIALLILSKSNQWMMGFRNKISSRIKKDKIFINRKREPERGRGRHIKKGNQACFVLYKIFYERLYFWEQDQLKIL